MKLEHLKYIVQISTLGSINKASQMLYVSQSTLSRAVQAVEEETGIVIFNRFQSGVTLTQDGEILVSRANKILSDMEELKGDWQRRNDQSLILGEERMTLAITAFNRMYDKYCKTFDEMDIIIKEGSRQEILTGLGSGDILFGLLYVTSNEIMMFEQDCSKLGLEYSVLDTQPLCVQVGSNHPIAEFDKVSVKQLSAYPRVAFLDEDVSGIHYCADTSKLDTNIVKKRILVRERGTLREVISGTEAYYIGTRMSNRLTSENFHSPDIVCVPIEDYGIKINIVYVYKKGHKQTSLETCYLNELKAVISEGNASFE